MLCNKSFSTFQVSLFTVQFILFSFKNFDSDLSNWIAEKSLHLSISNTLDWVIYNTVANIYPKHNEPVHIIDEHSDIQTKPLSLSHPMACSNISYFCEKVFTTDDPKHIFFVLLFLAS